MTLQLHKQVGMRSEWVDVPESDIQVGLDDDAKALAECSKQMEDRKAQLDRMRWTEDDDHVIAVAAETQARKQTYHYICGLPPLPHFRYSAMTEAQAQARRDAYEQAAEIFEQAADSDRISGSVEAQCRECARVLKENGASQHANPNYREI